MKELVEYVVRSLVSHPDSVDVQEIESDDRVIVELRVDPDDMGVVIGRKGRTVKAIRTLATTLAAQQDRQVRVEILE